ncbi:EamA family transporter RarD [Desulfococcaceae bacterium HSG9]|nr:EamA family transporter RarD [Desulfococcaceae bacterium HSG9]
MIGKKKPQKQKETLTGVLNAIGAFLIWGLSPIYFKILAHVSTFEILLHRMVWSFFFLFPIVILTGRWKEFSAAIANRRTLLILIGTTLLVSGNWFVFIWAINSGKILQTSLGYFINPLINVLLGMLFLKERLRPAQTASVILAAAGVFYMTIESGTFPWIALFLAISFSFYGLVRKIAAVNALVGVTVETMLLFFPASTYLYYLNTLGTGAFQSINASTDILLMGTALVTALPLLLFTAGARCINFATLGMLQYIAPSGTFILAVYVYNEPFQTVQLIAFILIWISLIIYSADSVIASGSGSRKNK